MDNKISSAREILSSKIGINKNYVCEGYVGDHNVVNSKDFEAHEVDFLEDIEINEECFFKIFEEYISDITKVIERNPNLKLYSVMDKESKFIDFDEKRIQENFQEFITKERPILDTSNKIVLKTFLKLLQTYDTQEILLGSGRIKKELKNGIFDVVSENTSSLTQDERNKINELNWTKSNVDNYRNLNLLDKRLKHIKENGKIDKNKIDELLYFNKYLQESGIPNRNEISQIRPEKEVTQDEYYCRLMANIYNEFEVVNREDIIASVYDKSDNNFRTEKLPNNMLVHFYQPEISEMLNRVFANTVINRERLRNGESILPSFDKDSRRFLKYDNFEQVYKEQIEEQKLPESVNEMIPNKTFNITDEDIENNLGYRLDVIKAGAKQIACTILSDNDVKDLEDVKVKFAVGFDARSMSKENIILSSNKNADSNLGKENIPCKNKFEELSQTFVEIVDSDAKRKEILLSRENLSVSYLLCLYDECQLDESTRNIIKQEKEKANKLGIEIVDINMQEIYKEKNVAEELER